MSGFRVRLGTAVSPAGLAEAAGQDNRRFLARAASLGRQDHLDFPASAVRPAAPALVSLVSQDYPVFLASAVRASAAQADHQVRPDQADSPEAAASRQMMAQADSAELLASVESVFPASAVQDSQALPASAAKQEMTEPAATAERLASQVHSAALLASAASPVSLVKDSAAFPDRLENLVRLADQEHQEPAAVADSQAPEHQVSPETPAHLVDQEPAESLASLVLERLASVAQAHSLVSREQSGPRASPESVRPLEPLVSLEEAALPAYLELEHQVSQASADRIPPPAKSTSYTTKPPM